jgi:hypothetical protein
LNAQEGTSFTVQGHSYNEVWNAAVVAMTRQLTIVSQDKSTGEIRAEKGVGMATWGEVVGVFISPPNPSAKTFTISVDSKKRDTFQITGQDWTQNIIADMQAQLDK